MRKIFLMAFAVVAVFVCSCVVCSCNVTRTITTSSTAFTKGDTCVQIISKTTEVYDATKKGGF